MTTDPRETDTVHLRCPAESRHLSLARAVAANIAACGDLDIEAVDDMKMAMDEACSSLIARATAGSPLECLFHTAGTRINVRLRVRAAAADPLDQSCFAWHVVSTLTDSAGTWVVPTPSGDGYYVYVDLSKARAATSHQPAHDPMSN
ncbi:MAG: ATP-binding protein [Streptosporangiales bacterium]